MLLGNGYEWIHLYYILTDNITYLFSPGIVCYTRRRSAISKGDVIYDTWWPTSNENLDNDNESSGRENWKWTKMNSLFPASQHVTLCLGQVMYTSMPIQCERKCLRVCKARSFSYSFYYHLRLLLPVLHLLRRCTRSWHDTSWHDWNSSPRLPMR